MNYRDKLYRAVNPVYASDPLSGRGAKLYGGRFNPKGMPALYCSLTILTAIKEANQAGSLQPTTLVSYNADIADIFNGQDDSALEPYGMSAAALADSGWRDKMKLHGKAPTQILAESLVAKGFNGMQVRSYAPGASVDDLNLVIWKWGNALPTLLTLIDDENRLKPPHTP